MRSFIIKPGDLIPIGRAGENQATEIRFDVTGWAETFGAGQYALVMKRPGESELPYPITVTTDGDYVVWVVSNVDTGVVGNAQVQLRYVVDGALAKSVIYRGIVGESLDNIVDPPDPYEDLIGQMVDLTERAEAAAESAAGSAGTATTAAEAAQTAKTAAETAAGQAQSAKEAAQSSATTATQAKEAAQTAQNAAEAAKAAATQSATAASGSATAAAGSASQAGQSATAAAGSATAAAQSAAAAQAAAMDVIDKAPIITDTASGAIASFPDGSSAPIKQLTVAVNPVQDLHGYDNPWPAGGGKNLLSPKLYRGGSYNPTVGTVWNLTESETQFSNPSLGVYTISFTSSWVAYVLICPVTVGQNYHLSYAGNSTGNCGRTIGYLDENFKVLSASNSTDTSFNVDGDLVFGTGVTQTAAFLYLVITNRSSSTATITINNPQIELGTTKTDFAPYSNICPITGRTGANVGVAGKNMWEMKAYAGGGYNPDVGTVWNLTLNGTQPSNPSNGVYQVTFAGSWYGLTLICPVKAGKKYRISYSGNSTGDCGRSYGLLDKNFTVLTKANDTSTTFTYDMTWDIPAKGAYFYLFITNRSSAGATITINNPQIEPGETKTDYAPYTGTSYPITWQSEAGTVYGGTLTVEQDGTGTLVATRKMVIFDGSDDEGWLYSSGYTKENTAVFYAIALPDAYYPDWTSYRGFLTNQFLNATRNYLYNNDVPCMSFTGTAVTTPSPTVRINKALASDVDAFKAYLGNNNLQFCYELATPVTYTLTAAEMATLFGQNNWWADCGDVSVDYRADTKLYIDKKLAALLAALS